MSSMPTGGRRRLELPADMGVARSLIAPGTAGTRDFSALSPLIRSSSRRSAWAAWPASAPAGQRHHGDRPAKGSLARRSTPSRRPSPDRHWPRNRQDPLRSHTKYGDVPAKKGIEAADFRPFIDVPLQRLAECVDVCVAQGHDAPRHGRRRLRAQRRVHARCYAADTRLSTKSLPRSVDTYLYIAWPTSNRSPLPSAHVGRPPAHARQRCGEAPRCASMA